jgi:hypothetical protein
MTNDNGFEVRNQMTDAVEMTVVFAKEAFELATISNNCGTPAYVWSRKLQRVMTDD